MVLSSALLPPHTASVGQRSELTFRENRRHGRHGWLRLTPAYSVGLVRSLLAEQRGARVLEPFSGSGTTALCAAELGMEVWAFDINAFLVWLGRAKVSHFAEGERRVTREAARELISSIRAGSAPRCRAPAMRNIERWWSPARLALLGELKAGIEALGARPAHTLLRLAFCRTLMALSNAAFDHPSMSFARRADEEQPALDEDLEQFLDDVEAVLSGASEPCQARARVELADARSLDEYFRPNAPRFDLVVTSPPYPNRMSYVRELRPYLYWLGYVNEARDAGELDWRAIGGTWGVATSRLAEWRPGLEREQGELASLLAAIGAHPTSGTLLAAYVHKYFEDMFRHLAAMQRLLARGANVHYIVGNSTFYGVTVPTERLLAADLAELGFERVDVRILRKRNSKKELFEFCVSARRA